MDWTVVDSEDPSRNLGKCTKHEDRFLSEVNLLNFSENKEELIFQCEECSNEKEVIGSRLILEDIINNKINIIFEKIMNDSSENNIKETLSFIKDGTPYQNIFVETREKFKEFRYQLNNILDRTEQYLQKKAMDVISQWSKLIKQFEELSEKEKIRKIIINPKMSLKEKSTNLKELIETVLNSSEKIQSTLNEPISNIKKQLSELKMSEMIKSTQIKIEEMLQNIERCQSQNWETFFGVDKIRELLRMVNGETPNIRFSLECTGRNDNFGDKGAEVLSQLTTQVSPEIISFNLSSNSITCGGLKELSSSISKLPKLDILQLMVSNNQIQDEGISFFANQLKSQTQLMKLQLDFSKNPISISGEQELAQTIKSLPKLHFLNIISKNNINGDQSLSIYSDSISNLSKIQILQLVYNNSHVTDEGLSKLALSIKNKYSIQKLNLQFKNNFVGSRGMTALSESIGKLNHLKELTLQFESNQIQDEGVLNLVGSIQRLQRLYYCELKLKFNFKANQINSTLKQQIQERKNKLLNVLFPALLDLNEDDEIIF